VAFDDAIATATIVAEASGEGSAGMRGVAWVIGNRLRSGRYGSTVAGVCLALYQFSCWNSDKADRRNLLRVAVMDDHDPVLTDAADAVHEAIASATADPIDGATLYHDVSVSPWWVPKVTFVCQIGNLLFYRE